MSVEAATWGWKQPVQNSTHRLVLIALCDNAAGPTAEVPGLCWPSIRSIAERCMISERQTKRVIEGLTGAGLIVKNRRRRRPDGSLSVWEYVVPFTDPPRCHSEQPPETLGATGDIPRCHLEHSLGDTHVPARTVSEPSSEPSSSSSAKALATNPDRFALFWQTYGNLAGTGKKKAQECWTVAMKRGDDPDDIIAGLEAWVCYWRTPGANKAMYAQGFLNQQKWATPPPPLQTDDTKRTRTISVLDNARTAGRAERLEAMLNPSQPKEINQ